LGKRKYVHKYRTKRRGEEMIKYIKCQNSVVYNRRERVQVGLYRAYEYLGVG